MPDPVNTDALRETALDLEPVRADERISNTQWARVHIAKRALFTAADEVDRLRMKVEHQRAVNRRNIDAMTGEHDRLRAVIENAPHTLFCKSPLYLGGGIWDTSPRPCTCWKADVL